MWQVSLAQSVLWYPLCKEYDVFEATRGMLMAASRYPNAEEWFKYNNDV